MCCRFELSARLADGTLLFQHAIGTAPPPRRHHHGATGSVKVMILEHALINIRPGTHQEFEAAITKAREVISAAPGFCSFALHRGIEMPDRYLLIVGWETLEAHTDGFRQSPAFAEWRSHIGPFFDIPPEVDHYDLLAGLS